MPTIAAFKDILQVVFMTKLAIVGIFLLPCPAAAAIINVCLNHSFVTLQSSFSTYSAIQC